MKNKANFIFTLCSAFVLSACAGGSSYIVENADGTRYEVDNIGHTNLARTGAQYSNFKLCDPNAVPTPGPGSVDARGCKTVAQETAVNPTLLQQLAGPGATVGAAKLIGDGLGNSGDTVNNNVQGGAGGDATAASGSWSNSTSTTSAHGGGSYTCKGNCN